MSVYLVAELQVHKCGLSGSPPVVEVEVVVVEEERT